MPLIRPPVRLLICLLATFAANSSQAGVLNLTQMIGGANVYAFNNFTSVGSDVEGVLVAGGNVALMNYSVNANNADAFATNGSGYSVVAGGDLTLIGGSIKNGASYVGGTMATLWADTAGRSATNPIDFSAAQSYYTNLSGSLSGLKATGATGRNGTGISLTGSGGSVDVFNLTMDQLNGATWWQTSNLKAGQTLVFNVSGATGGFNNMGFDQLTGYNVLFNFYQATNITVNGVVGSILAPNATVGGGNGVVHGNVIVNNWNAGTQIDADHFFRSVDVAGLNLATATGAAAASSNATGSSNVPEPASIALVLGGLAAAGIARRRRAVKH